MPSRHEALQAVERFKTKRHDASRDLQYALLETAAVRATELTGHPGWDKFLEQLQAKLDRAQAQAQLWTEKMKHSVGTDDMRGAQIEVVSYETSVNLLTEIMQIPQTVLKDFHDAAQSQ